jgi:hypothetical protein
MVELEEKSCGKQQIGLQAPDLLLVTLRGSVTREEIEGLLAARDALTKGLDHFLLLCRLDDFSGVTMAGNRALAEAPDSRPQAVTFLGASYRTRIVTEMVIRAANLFTQTHALWHFSSTEREAFIWLEGARAALCRRVGRAAAAAH